MEENHQKTMELLSGAKSCALILEQNPKEEMFLLHSALSTALKGLGIYVLTLPEENDAIKFYKEKWSSVLKEIPERAQEKEQKTVIKIPKKDFLIKELSYDENEEFFSLVITPKQGKFVKEDVIFEDALPEPDAVLCFSFDKKILEETNGKIKISESRENVILFYSETNGSKILTEKITDLLQLLQVDFSLPVLNLLFASLVLETGRFKNFANSTVFSLANFLLSRGADVDTVCMILYSERTDSFTQIIGRAAARSHYDENLEAMFSFLQETDFEKTNNSSSLNLILKIIRELEYIAKLPRIYAFFWQKGNEIFTVLKSENSNYLSELSSIFNIPLQSDYFLNGPYKNFSEAELKIREALVQAKLS